jgi:hypothetical protein
MASLNPFLSHPETLRAARAYAAEPSWREEHHEYPLLTLEIEALADPSCRSTLSEDLIHYCQLLTNYSPLAPALLTRLRIAAVLPTLDFHLQQAEESVAATAAPELLLTLYGIPEALTEQLLKPESLATLTGRPPLWPSSPPPLSAPHLRAMFKELGTTIVLAPCWRSPFSVVTRLRESFLFAATLDAHHPFELAALIHEAAHIRHLLEESRPLAMVTPWERELRAISAEHQFLLGLDNRRLLEEWFRRTISENRTVLLDEIAALQSGRLRYSPGRLPFSAALYACAALTLVEESKSARA